MMGAMIRPSAAGIPAWLGVVCLLVFGAAAQAQVRIVGRTISDTAAPVAGADVVLRTPASDDVVGRATSDAAGTFVVEIAGDRRLPDQRRAPGLLRHRAPARDADRRAATCC